MFIPRISLKSELLTASWKEAGRLLQKFKPETKSCGLKLGEQITGDTAAFTTKAPKSKVPKHVRKLQEAQIEAYKNQQNELQQQVSSPEDINVNKNAIDLSQKGKNKKLKGENVPQTQPYSSFKVLAEQEKEAQNHIETLLKSIDGKSDKFHSGGRLKSPLSAWNKTVVGPENEYNCKTNSEVINKVFDFHGVKRVALEGTTREDWNVEFDKMIRAIRAGKIEVWQIENKRPAILEWCPEEYWNILDYAHIKKLKEVKAAQEEVWGDGRIVELVESDWQRGNYPALHVRYRDVVANRFFERQHYGHLVEPEKHIDDPVWKGLDGKGLTGAKIKEKDKLKEENKYIRVYETVAQMNAPDNSTARKEFDYYRSVVMLMERIKERILEIPKKKLPTEVKKFKYVLNKMTEIHHVNSPEKVRIMERDRLFKYLDDYIANPKAEHSFVPANWYNKLPSFADYNISKNPDRDVETIGDLVAKCDTEYAKAKDAAKAAAKKERDLQIKKDRENADKLRKEKRETERQKRYEAWMAKEAEKYNKIVDKKP